MQTISRSVKTTFKQIARGGWTSWASIAIMTLSVLVTTVLIAVAYISVNFLQALQNDPHIYIFYKAGTPELKILEKKDELEVLTNVESVVYTSEEDALEEFRAYNEQTNPITAQAIREDVLPASLGIRLVSINEAQNVIDLIETERDNDEDILSIGYSEDVIQKIREITTILGIGGAIVIAMLIIVIFLFTFLTTEFKIYFRSEEIGIMQLVGGSLWYIRLPFILENMVYGMIGGVLSNLILAGTYFGVMRYYSETELIVFIRTFFGSLPWPTLTPQDWLIGALIIVAIGGVIGFINSWIAILRYIK